MMIKLDKSASLTNDVGDLTLFLIMSSLFFFDLLNGQTVDNLINTFKVNTVDVNTLISK